MSREFLRRFPGLYGRARSLIERVTHFDANELARFQQKNLARVMRWVHQLPDGYPHAQSFEQLPFLTKEDLRKHMPAYERRTLLPVSKKRTGGTTGIPLDLKRSLPSVVFEQAMIDWVVAQAGHDYARERVAVLRSDDIKPLDEKEPPYWEFADSRTIILSTYHLNPQTLPAYLKVLREFRPDILFVYATTADHFAQLARAAGETMHFSLVLSSSELLTTPARQRIGEIFNASVVDYYGQGERVAFAYSLEPDVYRFHPVYGYVELFPVADAAGEGTQTIEVVGTCYHNSAQVFARYKTSDSFELADADSDAASLNAIASGFKTFSHVGGRLNEYIYGPDGQMLTMLSQIPRAFEYDGRMQFIQDALDHVEILMHSINGASPPDLAARVLERSRIKIPSSVAVDISFVDELVRTQCGKTPLIIQRVERPWQ